MNKYQILNYLDEQIDKLKQEFEREMDELEEELAKNGEFYMPEDDDPHFYYCNALDNVRRIIEEILIEEEN